MLTMGAEGKQKRPAGRAFLALFVAVVSGLAFKSTPALAASATWTNSSSGAWSVASNWDTSIPPNGSGDTANFPSSVGSTQVNVDGTYNLYSLTFSGFGGNIPTFMNGQFNLYSGMTITGGADVTMNTRIVTQNDLTFNINSGSDIRLSGPNVLSGSHSLTLTGGGAIYNHGTESYTGDTVIQNGRFGSSGGDQWSPNSTFTLADNAGALLSACGGDQTIANLNGGAASNVEFCGARLTLGNAAAGNFSGTMQDGGNPNGGITKVGTGTFSLTGTSTNTGDTIVNAGSLNVDGTLTNSTVVVNTDGTLFGTGAIKAATVNGTVTSSGFSSTLHGGTFTFANGSTSKHYISPSGSNSSIAATTSITINPGSTLKVTPLAGTYTNGQTFRLLTAPSITGTFASVIDTSGSLNYQIKYYPTHVDLVIAPASGSASNVVTAGIMPPNTGFGAPRSNVVMAIAGMVSGVCLVTGLIAMRKKMYARMR